MTERRQSRRILFTGVIFISWKTFDGQRNHVLGRCTDVSERGIGLEAAIRIPAGSFVRVRSYGLNLDGSATVRRVSRLSGRYFLALELSQSLDAKTLAEHEARQSSEEFPATAMATA